MFLLLSQFKKQLNQIVQKTPPKSSDRSFSPSLSFLKIYFIYLFLTALGLRCCAQAFSSCGTRAFSSCGERGLLFVVVRRLLIAVASLVAEHGL